MPLPPYLKVQNDLLLLHVKVQPRASRNEIGEVMGQELKVKITAPPVESAANEELIRFLAEVLHCPRQAVTLVRGGSSRHKVIALRGIPAESIEQKLVSAK